MKLLPVVLGVAYPLLWYFGREAGIFTYLAAAMCALWLLRAKIQTAPLQRGLSLAAAVFFAAAWLMRQPQAMYWYPTAVSLLLLVLFGGSLFARQTVVERLARLKQPDLPPEGVRYTRRVTQVWCVFFIANGALSAVLVLSRRYDWWAAYTGLVSYLLMGLLAGGEWLYRKRILKI